MLVPILGWMLFGLIIGAIARAIYPGPQSMGLLRTMLLGIAGSFLGGLAGYFLQGGTMFQASGWIGSLLGAIALIAITNARRERAIG